MPGPYIHISSMKNTAARFASRRPFAPARSTRIDPTWTGANTVALGQLMQSHPDFASLGAIGPELFFFLPDFRRSKGILSVNNSQRRAVFHGVNNRFTIFSDRLVEKRRSQGEPACFYR